ncbi:hypothetical protein [Enhygromyxa salina]|uniref:Secreted protein n=1 Tax=Enhygromyxa salina TaxID=215803 RepID=A0A2S9YNH1_9BACT|nr:hypothetical protein [Enhygromyxa salina]PRQ06636.1 hypothetical protein ENSA7_36570 [Enhygromyxa salina]
MKAHRPVHLFGAMCLVLSCMLAGACDQRSGGGTVAPTGHGSDSNLTPEGEFEGESMGELDIRLQHLVEQQEQRVTAASLDARSCEDLCELSRAICEVKSKMCEIADERVGDDEYQDLCRVAKQRCQRAADSCVRCVEHHQRAGQSGGAKPEPASCGGDAE